MLSDISEEERDEAIAFYRGYFEEAGVENEAFILEELGSPEKIAEAIKRDLGMITTSDRTQAKGEEEEKKKRDRIIIALVIVIGILTSPGWLGIPIGILGTIFGVLAALIAATVAMFTVGFVLAGLGITMAAEISTAAGLFFVGAGLLALAIAVLFLLADAAVFGKFIPWVWKSIRRLWKKFFAKKGAQEV